MTQLANQNPAENYQQTRIDLFDAWKQLSHDVRAFASFAQNDWLEFPIPPEQIEEFRLLVEIKAQEMKDLCQATIKAYEKVTSGT